MDAENPGKAKAAKAVEAAEAAGVAGAADHIIIATKFLLRP